MIDQLTGEGNTGYTVGHEGNRHGEASRRAPLEGRVLIKVGDTTSGFVFDVVVKKFAARAKQWDGGIMVTGEYDGQAPPRSTRPSSQGKPRSGGGGRLPYHDPAQRLGAREEDARRGQSSEPGTYREIDGCRRGGSLSSPRHPTICGLPAKRYSQVIPFECRNSHRVSHRPWRKMLRPDRLRSAVHRWRQERPARPVVIGPRKFRLVPFGESRLRLYEIQNAPSDAIVPDPAYSPIIPEESTVTMLPTVAKESVVTTCKAW